MEVALTWLFGSVHHRVPSGRAPSFTQPLLPPTRSNPHARPPPGVHACPLPPPRTRPRPLPATVAHGVDEWANHSAFYITNSRGQRLFVQLWRPLPHCGVTSPHHTSSGSSSSSNDDAAAIDCDDGDDGEYIGGDDFAAGKRAVKRRRGVGPHLLLTPLRWTVAPARYVGRLATGRRRRRRSRRSAFSAAAAPQPQRPRGIVHILHGLNDHSNKYAGVARAWVQAGYIVAAHDAHGHGRSDGFRAHTSSMAHYVADARLAMDEAAARLPRRQRRRTATNGQMQQQEEEGEVEEKEVDALPRFIVGHSLGGAVAIHVARDMPPPQLRGVMLTAPAVRVFPRPLLKLLAPVLATLAPLQPVQRLKFDRRRRTPQQQQQHQAGNAGASAAGRDPLVVRSAVRARVGYEVLKSCEKIMSAADEFRVPLFVGHSRGDRVTNARGSAEFVRAVASKERVLRLYDGRAHDLLADGAGADRDSRGRGNRRRRQKIDGKESGSSWGWTFGHWWSGGARGGTASRSSSSSSSSSGTHGSTRRGRIDGGRGRDADGETEDGRENMPAVLRDMMEWAEARLQEPAQLRYE